MSIARTLLAALGLWLFAIPAIAQQIEVLWLGHSAFRITSVAGKVIVIDPFITTNPRAPAKYKDLAALGKVDLILVTHGHRDHIQDVSALSKLTGARVIANFELAKSLVAAGLVDPATTPAGMNKKIIHFDDQYFLGLGPRVGEALMDLVKALHPELAQGG